MVQEWDGADWGQSESNVLERAIEGSMDGVAILGPDGRYATVNQTHAELYGYEDPEAMVGESWQTCYEEPELERFQEEVLPETYDEGAWRGAAVGVRTDGTEFEQELSLTTFDDDGLICVVRDVSDRVERKEELKSTTSLLSKLVENIPVGILAENADREVLFANERFCTLLDIDADPQELVGTDCANAARRYKDLFTDPDRFVEQTDESVENSVPVEQESFDLVDGRTLERSAIPVDLDGDTPGHLWVYRDVTRRTRYERRLNDLHETTRELMMLSSPPGIASLASEAVTDLLDLPLNGFHLYDERTGELVPVAWSETAEAVVGVPPTFSKGEGLVWETFEAGEPRVFDDLQAVDGVYNPETEIRSEIQLPLGSHGIFVVGALEPGAFDETDVSLAKLFATNIETALDRAADERALKQRERELQQRNDQLNQFANVLSHDLRNPLNVASGRVELLDVDSGDDNLEAIRRAHSRMEALIDDTLTLARHGDPIGETTAVPVADTARAAWSQVETPDARLEVDLDLELDADESRLQQLFENLFRNAAEHGGTGVTVRVGELDDGAGFYVEDDGGGIPPDDRASVFDHGFSTTTDGTGFGLAIVQQIVHAHDWEIAVAASESGGARFEIRGGDRRGEHWTD